jgi:hypothetical protein
MRVERDDRHPVGRQELRDEAVRLDRHPQESDETRRHEARLEEEDQKPPRRSAIGLRRRRTGQRVAFGETRDFRDFRGNPLDRLKRSPQAIHDQPKIREIEIRHRFAVGSRNVGIHDDAFDPRLLAVTLRSAGCFRGVLGGGRGGRGEQGEDGRGASHVVRLRARPSEGKNLGRKRDGSDASGLRATWTLRRERRGGSWRRPSAPPC